MKPTKSDKPTDTQPSPSTVDDALSNLAAITEEERALSERKEAARRAVFDKITADGKTLISTLTAAGFALPVIAKAWGFAPIKTSPPSSPTPKPSGPTSHQGWFNLFRSRAIQDYLRAHPTLAARLKAESIKSVDYPHHIPPPDLESIDAQAHLSAAQRCPSTPSVS